MTILQKTISVKQWQLFVMLGMSGFAVGNILAKLTTAIGF
jgi:hypothetical protein